MSLGGRVVCLLLLAQNGCLTLVGLHFQVEQIVLQTIKQEFVAKQYEREDELEPFRVDELFEMNFLKRVLRRFGNYRLVRRAGRTRQTIYGTI